MSDIRLQPSVFVRGDRSTDFEWMMDQPQYQDTLFVFNDNESQFLAFHEGRLDDGCRRGGGNAAIRPQQCASPPRAAGMPTGPGYKELTPEVAALIDRATEHIAQVVAEHGYERVVYSAAEDDPSMIGVSIFEVGEDVRRYCITSLTAKLSGK